MSKIVTHQLSDIGSLKELSPCFFFRLKIQHKCIGFCPRCYHDIERESIVSFVVVCFHNLKLIVPQSKRVQTLLSVHQSENIKRRKNLNNKYIFINTFSLMKPYKAQLNILQIRADTSVVLCFFTIESVFNLTVIFAAVQLDSEFVFTWQIDYEQISTNVFTLSIIYIIILETLSTIDLQILILI